MQHFKKGIFFWIANLFTHPSNLNSVERDERVAKKKRLYFVYSFNLAFFADDKSLKAWKIRFLYIPNFSLYAKKATVMVMMMMMAMMMVLKLKCRNHKIFQFCFYFGTSFFFSFFLVVFFPA